MSIEWKSGRFIWDFLQLSGKQVFSQIESLRKIDGNSTEMSTSSVSSGWFSGLKICGTLYYVKAIRGSLGLQMRGLWRHFPQCSKNPAPWILVFILLKWCTVTYVSVEEAWMSPGFKEIKDRLTFVLGANKCQWRFSCVTIFINDNYFFLFFFWLLWLPSSIGFQSFVLFFS